jgi:phage terminase large subunit GpA-like protein
MATTIRPLDVPESISSAVDVPFETALLPDPDLDVSEWADEYRTLSRVSAGEPGRWRTTRTPFLREIMDCLSPSSPFTRVVFVKPVEADAGYASTSSISR